MRRPSRRTVLLGLGAGAAGVVGLRCAVPWWLRVGPVRAVEELSDEARALVAAAWAGLDPARVLDLHVHVVGFGRRGSGCWVNPRFASHLHPLERLRFELYLAAGGVHDDDEADERYVERLLALLRAAGPAAGAGPRALVLAFDARVGRDGTEERERSMFVVPDEYVCGLARAHPELLACASVHPYRRDALERLERAHAAGAVAVKWLPNAMGIDPAAEVCRPFYAKLAELGLPLLVHTGEERAVWSADEQEFGNPLRLRAALEQGVTVVALHCASLGEARDLENGGAPTPTLELCLRLLERQCAGALGPGRLFGELAAVTLANRPPDVLATLLARAELHPWLVNGSDYPLVAIDPLVLLRPLVWRGVLAPEERAPLAEIAAANALLFDLVLKRRLRLPTPAEERRFAPGDERRFAPGNEGRFAPGDEGRFAPRDGGRFAPRDEGRFAPVAFESARLFDKL